MRRILFLLLSLTGLQAGSVMADDPATGKTVVLAADKWCPVNCASNAELPGYAVELAREAFALAGWQFEYRVMPWERAIDAARAGRIDGVIGAIPANTPDFLFPDESIGHNVNVFFRRADSAWRYRGIRSLEKVVVGVANEYRFGEPFDGYVERYKDDPAKVYVIFSPDPVQQGLDLLAAGRIDTYVDDRMVVDWALRQAKVENSVREANQLSDEPLYIAFSPAREDARATAQAFAQGVRELRASGRLAAILRRYGVSDWGPEKKAPKPTPSR